MSRELAILTALGLMLIVTGSAGAQSGSILIEEWFTADTGQQVNNDVTTLHNFINEGAAPSRSYLAPKMDRPDGGEDYWGGRMRGYLYPPQSGEYTFWTASDDDSEVWLSTDDDPANATMICNVEGWMNYQDWTYGSGAPGNTYKSAPIPLQAGKRYYIDVFFSDGTGGGFATVAWGGPGIGAGPVVVDGRYLSPFVVLTAQNPNPANGAMDFTNPLFQWTPGDGALFHDVYIGTTPELTEADMVSAHQPFNMFYYMAGLEPGVTYYWRVDETDAAGVTHTGPVWNFTTPSPVPPVPVPLEVINVIDDFEGYTDDEGNRIYETWIDGFINGTGSRVGHPSAPFAERTIVLAGLQSMPMGYNNAEPPFYSETARTFETTRDWTIEGATDISLWVRGNPATTTVNDAGGKITIQGEGTDIWNNSDQFTYYYKTLSGNGSIVARVTSSGTGSNTWAKGGVMIRSSLDAGATHAMMIATGGSGNGASFQWRAAANMSSANADKGTPGISPPCYVQVQRTGDRLSGYVSLDGTTWTQLGTAQSIAMGAQVYIGLCVTSHAADEYRTFQFDSVSTTGSVTGTWETKEIGLARNDPQPLYMAVEDSAGRIQVVTHPDPAVTTTVEWTEWQIPLSEFTGVNLNNIRKVYLGVGDRNRLLYQAGMISAAAAAGSSGTVYFDCFTLCGPRANAYLNGYVRNKSTNAGISGAKVVFTGGPPTSYGSNGYYWITLAKGTYTVTATATNYTPNTFTLTIAPVQISGRTKLAISVSSGADVQLTPQRYMCGAIGLDIFLK
jgi:hypothetical protein